MTLTTKKKTLSNKTKGIIQFSLATRISLLVICLVISLRYSEASASYDPDPALDGIPVFSAHSRRGAPSQITERIDNHRRRSDPEPEEVDDYDDDNDREWSSSSNKHDTYENPGYGESQGAAKDGEDIEKFFDRHIGPDSGSSNDNGQGSDPDDRELNPHSSLAPVSSSRFNGDFPANRRQMNMDDNFDMAASSPLATIFQTLLNAHKSPIVIETNDISATIGTSSSVSTDGQGEDGSSSGSSSASSSSSSTPQAVVGGAPSFGGHMTPISTYMSPVAAPSSLSNYGFLTVESAGGGQDQSTSDDSGSQISGGGPADDDGSGQIQEIYIGRRPTLMKHFQTYSPTNKKLQHQSSNAAYWRGPAGSPSSSRQPYKRRPMAHDHSAAYNPDYARHPVVLDDVERLVFRGFGVA